MARTRWRSRKNLLPPYFDPVRRKFLKWLGTVMNQKLSFKNPHMWKSISSGFHRIRISHFSHQRTGSLTSSSPALAERHLKHSETRHSLTAVSMRYPTSSYLPWLINCTNAETMETSTSLREELSYAGALSTALPRGGFDQDINFTDTEPVAHLSAKQD